MYISLNWLQDFLETQPKLSPEELGQLLTLKTAEVEAVENQSEKFENMVVGKILKIEAHPDADKLRIAQVEIGDNKPLQVVCGAANIKEGMKIAFTKIGAKVQWHGEDEITISKAKVRGVESHGMIAAGSEIGVKDSKAGPKDIMDLSENNANPGAPLSEALNLNDHIIEIDNKSLTHRPDLWGHYGIAREVAAITESKLKKFETKVEIPKKGQETNVKIEDDILCPRFCTLIIKNVKVTESPEWLQRRLQAIGHGTHNNIVDVTNYVMAEIGQPMHAFDQAKIEGGLIIRQAQKGETLKTLDGKELKLSNETGIVSDHKKPVSIAGVIGGANSEIDNNTTTIILEAANWHPTRVRRTSIEIGTRTDAVQRFEKSLDPENAETAIKRASEIILQICPEAEIAGPITDRGTYKKENKTVQLDTNKVRSKIGIKISNQEIKEILEKLEFKITEKSDNIFQAEIPSFRATKDVSIEEDLIEEVARIYGYDNIPATAPKLPIRLPAENSERSAKHQARRLFSYGLGFDEVYNYSFYGTDELANCLMTDENHIKLQNYLSSDQTHLRTSMIPNIIKNLAHNSKYFNQVNIYEIGRTYKEIGQFMPLEEKRIGGAVFLKEKDQDQVFYQAKGAIESFLAHFRIPHIESVKDIKDSPYAHPNKSLSYIDGHGQTIARVFIVHPTVAKNHGLEKNSIALFDINFSEVMKVEKNDKKYQSIGKFPGIEIDISVLIDEEIEIGIVQESIKKAAPELIKTIQLFDLYQGKNIQEGKKAVAFKVTLQSAERTLTDQDMSTVQQTIFTNINKIGGEIRGS